MAKRFISWILILSLLASSGIIKGLGKACDFAALPWISDAVAENSDFEIDSDGTLLAYHGDDTTIIVPDSVTSISDYVFYELSNDESIVLPDQISSVSGSAFAYEGVTIHANYDSLTARSVSDAGYNFYVPGDNSFALRYEIDRWYEYNEETGEEKENRTEKLALCEYHGTASSVTIPGYVQAISDNVFEDHTEIENVTIPESVTEIRYNAFSGCTGLQEITIPSGIKAILGNAFYGCASLAQVNLPEGLETIEYSAFYDCDSLTGIDLPDQVTCHNAFNNENLKIHANYDSLTARTVSEAGYNFYVPGDNSFALRYEIDRWYEYNEETGEEKENRTEKLALYEYHGTASSVTIPGYVQAINDNVFEDHTEIENLTIPENVTEIRYNAFSGCTGLQEITIPSGIKTIPSSAFSGCASLAQVNLPEGLETIEYYAFYDCDSLTSLGLPDQITSVYSAFENCPAKLFCDSESATAKALSDAWYSFYLPDEPDFALQYQELQDVETLCLTHYSGNAAIVTIPSYVESISSYAFEQSAVKKVIIPESVVSISYGAFYDCNDLAIVYLPYAVEYIDYWAFEYCNDNLTLYVYADTYADQYAQEMDHKFAYRNASLRVNLNTEIPATRVALTDAGGNTATREANGSSVLFSSVQNGGVYSVEWMNQYGDVFAKKEGVFIENGVNEVELSTDAVTATVHAVVRDCVTRENLTQQTTIIWETKDGNRYAESADLLAVPVGTELVCRAELDEALLNVYAEYEPQSCVVTDGEQYLSIPLTEYETRTVTGGVSPASAKIVAVQKASLSNKSFATMAQTDDSGNFTLTLPNLPADLTVTADGFESKTVSLAADASQIQMISLTAMAGAHITLALTAKRAAASAAEQATENLPLSALSVSIKNQTTGNDITSFTSSDDAIFLPAGCSAGDRIAITLSGSDYIGKTETVTLDSGLTASASITLTEKGSAVLNVQKTEKDALTLFLFDANGQFAARQNENGARLQTPALNAGHYTAVIVETSDFVDTPQTISALSAIAHAEESIDISDGLIASYAVAEVPALDETAFYAVDPAKITFKSSRASVSLGKNYTISASASGWNEDATDFQWVFEIPENSEYVENTLSIGGEMMYSAEIVGNRIIVPVSDPSQTTRFCVLPILSGMQNTRAWLSYIQNGSRRTQPMGLVNVEIEPLKLTVQAKTYKTNVLTYGTGPISSEVKIYDGDVLVGETSTEVNGTWRAWIELDNPGTYSTHRICARFFSRNSKEFSTEAALVQYQFMEDPVAVSTIVMHTGSKTISFTDANCVTFDFEDPARTTGSYSFNPSFPTFSFLVHFTGNTEKVSNVKIYVVCSDGSTEVLKAEFNETYGDWFASKDLKGKMPTGVTAQFYNAAELIISNGNENAYVDLDELLQSVEEGNTLSEIDISASANISEKLASAIDRYNASVRKLKETSILIDASLNQKTELLDFVNNDTLIQELADIPDESEMSDYEECYQLMDEESEISSRSSLLVQSHSLNLIRYTPASGSVFRYYDIQNGTGYSINRADTAYPLDAMKTDVRWMQDASETMIIVLRNYEQAANALISQIEEETGTELRSRGVSGRKTMISRSGFDLDFMADVIKNVMSFYGKDATSYIPFFDVISDGIALQDMFDRLRELEKKIEKYPFCTNLKNARESLLNAMTLKAWQTCAHFLKGFAQAYAVATGNIPAYIAISQNKIMPVVDIALDIAIAGYEEYYNRGVGGSADENPNCPPDPNHPTPPSHTIPSVDPSGFVYEAVESNRVQGVTATVIQRVTKLDMYDEEYTEDEVWNAAQFNQTNPQTTNENGEFAWDVPDGLWSIKFSKRGYEDAQTEWMEVPPERKDVRVGIVSREKPIVLAVTAQDNGYLITFSKYMLAEQMANSIALAVDGSEVPLTLTMVNGEENPQKHKLVATKVLAVPATAPSLSSNVVLTISGQLSSYADVALGEDSEYSLGEQLTGIEAPNSIELQPGASKALKLKLYPANLAIGRRVNVTASDNCVSVSSSAIVDENGEAIVYVSMNSAGSAVITYSVSGSSLTAQTNVVSAADPLSFNTLRLPAFMTVIEEEAFSGIAAVTVVIPESCERIGARAFADCPNLKYVIIPANSTAQIAEDAFDGCGAITIIQE